MVNMIRVASSEGVGIYCPEGGRFSFFNSPYPAHNAYSAIDIYPESEFYSTASSPVYGKVVGIKRVHCPEKMDFETSIYDYVILMRSLENPSRWVKILHVKPTVRLGEVLKPGDNLGFMLRSGFFDFWTDPHIHVEIRDPLDPVRARGGFKIERLIMIDDSKADIGEICGRVIKSKKEYSLLLLKNNSTHGIPVRVGDNIGILDAGIPHYGFFGIHTSTQPSLGDVIKLCNVKIGFVESIHSKMCLAKCPNLTFKLKDKPVKLSLYFNLSKPLVKVIPSKMGELKLKEFEEVSILFSYS
ncbi:MAG: hypothetical protein QXX94_05890 [Candidatus Bathyarchaeia archaeon]